METIEIKKLLIDRIEMLESCTKTERKQLENIIKVENVNDGTIIVIVKGNIKGRIKECTEYELFKPLNSYLIEPTAHCYEMINKACKITGSQINELVMKSNNKILNPEKDEQKTD